MYWSTEDHHPQNYYNNLQIVQHQNGLQQATAAVPSPQQQHPTPPPPLQQQQRQQHPQQHQQMSHRAAQQIPHYATNQQLQHPQYQHHQWAQRPPVLTAPQIFQQFPTTVPSSSQYCAAPASYFHPQRVTQTSAAPAPPQQRPCLPPGCAMYPLPPQAAALRQNVITQPPANIMTPTTSAGQQMQVQFYSAQQYCQPPMVQSTYGHMIAPMALPETPVVKQRKHAIPIIDPDTKENIFERELRRSESASPADALSITPTSSTTTIDLKESEEAVEEEEPTPTKQIEEIAENEPAEEEKQEEVKENSDQVEEDTPDSSAQSSAVLDHVESIEPKEEVKEEEETTMAESNSYDNGHSDDADQIQSTSSTAAIASELEVESKCSDNEDNDDKETSISEGNLPPPIEASEKPSTSPKAASATAKVNKQQQTQKPLPTSKKSKKNKRGKESQKKQRADLINNNENNNNNNNNNNTNKITNQNQNRAKQTMTTEPYNSNRLTAKAKENSVKPERVSAIQAENGSGSGDDIIGSGTATPLEEPEKSDESSDKVDDSTETSNTIDDNDQSSQLDDSPKLTKTEQIASEILGIELTDDNELLFLNSSVSGYEEDICSSPAQEAPDNDRAENILFGDFSQESSAQEISVQQDEKSREQESTDDEDSQASTPKEDKKFAYTLQELKSLAGEPASKIAPNFRGSICEVIGKNTRGSAEGGGAAYQQNQMYQQMSYKDSMNYLNKRRNKRMNDVPHQQQFEQQQRNPNIIRINLSLNEEIKLAKSENAWVPGNLQNCTPKSEAEDDEQMLKKIRGILNKLTPENFDKLLQSAANFPMTGEERVKKVMLLIFEKTVSEPNFAPTYARFCKFLFSPENQNHKMFKRILISRIQYEFESNVNNAKAKNAKLKPIMDRLAAATDPKEKMEIKAELDDQDYQFRRRAWGTVRFIGEMYKLEFISTERVCSCVENLLDPRCEEKLEYLCKLLTTVGAKLEPTRRVGDWRNISERLDRIFHTIRQLVEKKKGAGLKISSRVRFMMQDVLELRVRSWDQKDQKDQKVMPMLPSREVSPAFTRGPSNSQRGPQSGGYDKYDKRRQQLDGQKNSSQLNIDMDKLKYVFSNREESVRQLGNPLMWKTIGRPQQQQQQHQRLAPPNMQRYQSRSQEPEPKEPAQLQKAELTSSECERLLNGLVEVTIEEKSPKEWFAKWSEIASAHHPTIVYYLLTEYLHSRKVKRPEIDACTRLFASLLKENLLTRFSFAEGYRKFSEVWDDILVDVPKGWQYIFDFLGPLLHLELIPFNFVWDKNWFNTPGGDKFLQSMIIYFTSEFGANYMRYFWDVNSLHWKNFIAEERVERFIASNSFEFIENQRCVPPIFIKRSADELVQRIKALLEQSNQNIDLIIDFISTNVNITSSFIQNLTKFLCDVTVMVHFNTPNSSNISSYSSKKSKLSDSPPSTSSGTTTTSSYKLREDFFVTKCIPLLRRCIDSKDEYELSCLDAIVERCKQLYDASAEDLICAMLMELYGEVISKESFEKWHQEQQSNGKLSNDLNSFFKNLPI